MKKAQIIDTLSYRSFHEVFNASILMSCLQIFDHISYHTSNSSFQNVKRLIDQQDFNSSLNNLDFKRIKVIEPSDFSLKSVFRYILSAFLNIWYLIICNRESTVIYFNNNPISLWPINLINFLLRRNIVIFCHGELEVLLQHPSVLKPSFYYKFIIKSLFASGCIHSKIKFGVLGDSILTNFQPFIRAKNKNHIFSINHPYLFSKGSGNILEGKKSLSIGTVGVLTPEKGLFQLLEIAEKLKNDVQITVVGRVSESIDYDKYPYINFVARNHNNFLSRQVYEEEILKLDYIIFLYGGDSYKLTASGAIFDAIDFEKPIVALRNDYFSSFEKASVGYFVDNYLDMVHLLEQVNENRISYIEEYSLFKRNICQLKKNYSVSKITADLKKYL